MDFFTSFQTRPRFLMEGALGERLKREYRLVFDPNVAMAGLVYQEEGRRALRELWQEYASLAQEYSLPFLATTPTRRANRERVAASGFPEEIIEDNVRFLKQVRETCTGDFFAGGLMGCRGDAYRADELLGEKEAEEFHAWQAERFLRAGAEFLYAGIMPSLPEAVGMARAMANTGLPYIISFMIRRDGRLIDGTPISAAVREIDAKTERIPLCYMTNCVHPDVLLEALNQPCNEDPVMQERFCGIQANTSPLSPEELDGSADLKCSGAEELSDAMMRLEPKIHLKIAGGCCGTNTSHMREVARRISRLT